MSTGMLSVMVMGCLLPPQAATGNRVMTSSDGIRWTLEQLLWITIGLLFVMAMGCLLPCTNGGTGNRVMTSPDGITWTLRASVADIGWYSVCYGNGLFVAVANSGTDNRVMISPDGVTWTLRTAISNTAWYSVAYGNNRFVVISNSNTQIMVATVVRQELLEFQKCILDLGVITASYMSSTVVTFNLKNLAPDISIIGIENIIAQFTGIQKVTTTATITLTWTYNNATGVLTYSQCRSICYRYRHKSKDLHSNVGRCIHSKWDLQIFLGVSIFTFAVLTSPLMKRR